MIGCASFRKNCVQILLTFRPKMFQSKSDAKWDGAKRKSVRNSHSNLPQSHLKLPTFYKKPKVIGREGCRKSCIWLLLSFWPEVLYSKIDAKWDRAKCKNLRNSQSNKPRLHLKFLTFYKSDTVWKFQKGLQEITFVSFIRNDVKQKLCKMTEDGAKPRIV